MQAFALSLAPGLGLVVALVALGALVSRLPAPAFAKRAMLTVLLGGFQFVLSPWLPEDMVARGLVLVIGAFSVAGTLIAVEWRVRNRVEPDSLGSYLFDVQTVAVNRTVPELATPGASLPRRALRGFACAGVVLGATHLLRSVAPESLPLLVWIYLKLQVVGLGAQALSDLQFVAWCGRVVPLMRWPLLSTSFLDFWGRRYNLWIHGLLLWLARDVLGLRRRPRLLLVAAFLVSGALHEVMSFLLLREWKGFLMAFWVAQLALTFASVALSRALRGSRAAPVLGLLFVHAGMCVSAPLFFAVFDRSLNLFGPVTPLFW